jgi:hypothetical protein
MHRDFREQLYAAGLAMDRDGIKWTILSGFRDDYRQTIASGLKARTGNSLHGGSRVTCGYGCGRAADLATVAQPVWQLFKWIDKNGRKFGLHRPMPGFDPAHVQPSGSWNAIASALRVQRTGVADTKVAAKAKTSTKIAVKAKPSKTKVVKRASKKRYAKRAKRQRYAWAH